MLTTRPWLTAPAALIRRPAMALVAVLGGLLVGMVAATPLLFADTVGAGAVQRQWDRACPADVEPHVEGAGMRALFGADDALLARVVGGLAAFGPVDVVAESGAMTFRNGERHAVGGLLWRDKAIDHLDVLSSTDHGELWISDTAAASLGVSAGDSIALDTSTSQQSAGGVVVVGGGPLPTTAVIRGVFRDMTKAPLDDYWCGAAKQMRAGTVFTDAVPPPKAIIDPSASSFVNALRSAGGLNPARVNLPFAVAPRTLPDAQAQLRAIPDLAAAIDATIAERATAVGLPSSMFTKVALTDNMDRLTARSAAVKHAVGVAVRPLSLLALASALAVVAALGSMWVRVKRNDVVALSSMGIGPGWLGVKAALECLPWLAAGAVGGAALARVSLAAYAPATDLEAGTWWRAMAVALAAAVVAMVLVGVTAGVTGRSVLRAVPRRVPALLTWFPLEAVLAVLAVVSYRSFRHGSLVQVRGEENVVGDAALTFPLLCFAAVAVLLARLWFVAMRRTGGQIRFVPAGLALRRLQHGRRLGAVLVALGALAVSVALYGAGLVASLDYTGHAKSRVYVGSDVRAEVRTPLGTPLAGMTQTFFVRDASFAGVNVEVVAVDPGSFAAGAFWDESFSDRPLGDLLDLLAASPTTAIAVGDVPAAGTVTNRRGKGSFELTTVIPAAVFPGVKHGKPLVVVSQATLAGSGMNGQNVVLARGQREQVLAQLAAAGTEPFLAISADNVIDVSELLFASWTFVFVRALGVFVGLLVIVALLLQLVARQRQQALGFGVLRRFGLSSARHRLALALELLALAAAMCVVGVAGALLVSRLVVPRLDPMKVIPPPPLVVVPSAAIFLLMVAMASSAALGSTVAQATGERMNLAEALRDG